MPTEIIVLIPTIIFSICFVEAIDVLVEVNERALVGIDFIGLIFMVVSLCGTFEARDAHGKKVAPAHGLTLQIVPVFMLESRVTG